MESSSLDFQSIYCCFFLLETGSENIDQVQVRLQRWASWNRQSVLCIACQDQTGNSSKTKDLAVYPNEAAHNWLIAQAFIKAKERSRTIPQWNNLPEWETPGVDREHAWTDQRSAAGRQEDKCQPQLRHGKDKFEQGGWVGAIVESDWDRQAEDDFEACSGVWRG